MNNTTIKKVCFCIFFSLTLVACSNQSPPPDGGRIPMSTSTKGAIIGGVAGGGLGSLGHSTGATVAGAVAGAALGALVGYEIDKEETVKISEHATGVRLVQHDKNMTLIMPSDIYFKSNEARVEKKYYPMLDDLVNVLKTNPDTFIEIVGYTDNQEKTTTSQELGKIRADNVTAYLQSQGIPLSRMHSFSRGEASPQATNGTPQGRKENRRVEIKLWPISQRI